MHYHSGHKCRQHKCRKCLRFEAPWLLVLFGPNLTVYVISFYLSVKWAFNANKQTIKVAFMLLKAEIVHETNRMSVNVGIGVQINSNWECASWSMIGAYKCFELGFAYCSAIWIESINWKLALEMKNKFECFVIVDQKFNRLIYLKIHFLSLQIFEYMCGSL